MHRSEIAALGHQFSLRPTVWLLQDGEPLPIDDSARLMRTGDQARCLLRAGYAVTWWASRFNHNLKSFRQHKDTWCSVAPNYKIVLLDGPAYKTNLSWRRMHHYRKIAKQFSEMAKSLPPPEIIWASYPSPELCDAGRQYAQTRQVPFVIDIRDPWPDIFSEYLPHHLRWGLQPLLWYYRKKLRNIARHADSIVAVSESMLKWGVEYAGRQQTEFDQVLYIGSRRQGEERQITVPQAFTPEHPLICLFATTCGRSYDGDVLVDAARILEIDGERRVQFVVSGDGEMRSRWVERAKGLLSVQFTGWISNDELQARFRMSHVGLILMTGGITKFWLGNKIFEYLSASLLVINNISGEMSSLVDSRNFGLNIAQHDARSLAKAVRHLVGDPDRVRIFMENARNAFRREFDRLSIEAKYLRHLTDLTRIQKFETQ